MSTPEVDLQPPVLATCSPPGLVYEVELALAQSPETEAVLADHVTTAVHLPAVTAGRLYRLPDEAAGYVAQFTIADAEDFERSAKPAFAREHAALTARFGEALQIRDRLLLGAEERYPAGAERCLNCTAIVTGQYCWHCGQRARARMITLGELLRGLTTDLVQFESRLWRSLRPLLFSPGTLTADYLAGRRVRYMPPFRMYLVLSLVFFLLITLGVGGISVDIGADLRSSASTAEQIARADSTCDFDLVVAPGLPFIGSALTPELLAERCRRIVMNPQRYIRQFVDALPVSLLLLLPLLAGVMKLLYLFSGRYYVEHLLFFVHYHAFLFLFVMLLSLALRLLAASPLPASGGALLGLSGWAYSLCYPYRAMRRVYGQGRGLTLVKLALLLFAYSMFILFMILATLVITALRA